MASWKFLQDFASFADPLTDLIRKGRKYEWREAQEIAFQVIKALIASAPVLVRPNFEEQFVFHTSVVASASDTGIAVLLV